MIINFKLHFKFSTLIYIMNSDNYEFSKATMPQAQARIPHTPRNSGITLTTSTAVFILTTQGYRSLLGI
jgi:hypothetical protein